MNKLILGGIISGIISAILANPSRIMHNLIFS